MNGRAVPKANKKDNISKLGITFSQSGRGALEFVQPYWLWW
jgi:hypothetical protein